MTFQRLPETLHTVYAELLDQTIQAEAGASLVGLPPETFVAKTVSGRRYWYVKRIEAGRKRQIYLGPESPALLEWMKQIRARRADAASAAQPGARSARCRAKTGFPGCGGRVNSKSKRYFKSALVKKDPATL